jgi:hypothetical protein
MVPDDTVTNERGEPMTPLLENMIVEKFGVISDTVVTTASKQVTIEFYMECIIIGAMIVLSLIMLCKYQTVKKWWSTMEEVDAVKVCLTWVLWVLTIGFSFGLIYDTLMYNINRDHMIIEEISSMVNPKK